MTGYWEPSHIRKHVGDLMLARIFGSSAQQAAVQWPHDFGVRVDSNTVDSDSARIRAEGIRYRYSHPFEADKVEREVEVASLRPFNAKQIH